MLTDKQIDQASKLLVEHWERGRRMARLPEAIRPRTRAEGYAIQARIERHTAKPVFGWKIAATSKAGQAHIGVDGPMAGRLLAERVLPDGGSTPLGANHMRVAEVEFAFRMGRDLAPRPAPYSTDEVLAAVDTLHPAIEIPDSRYDDFVTVGAPHLIADNACAHLVVVGAAAKSDWRKLDLAAHKGRGANEGKFEREGSGANVLGDPRVALAWLANELRGLGLTLARGQIVITGTCVKPMEVEAGDHILADLGSLGGLSIRFT
ncbi:MAG: 2-keto-4-pentenoate hydratase [Hypericibacter sp.]